MGKKKGRKAEETEETERQRGRERWERLTALALGVNSGCFVATNCGQTKTIAKLTLAASGRSHSQGAHTRRESCSRRSALRPSSPTLPFVSAAVCSSSRTGRRLRHSSQMTAASTSLTTTTKC